LQRAFLVLASFSYRSQALKGMLPDSKLAKTQKFLAAGPVAPSQKKKLGSFRNFAPFCHRVTENTEPRDGREDGPKEINPDQLPDSIFWFVSVLKRF
jgi:hypothetical protein